MWRRGVSPGWNGEKGGRRSLHRSVTSMEEGVPRCGGQGAPAVKRVGNPYWWRWKP